MKIVVAITGASGALYARELLKILKEKNHDVEIVASDNAKIVWADELGEHLKEMDFKIYSNRDFKAPFASGSALYDQMIIIPCSMGTLARIAHGISNDLISRSADVFLKEKRKLILVPRDTPMHLIHLENMKQLMLAGATLIPANPSFYSKPQTVTEVVHTVVSRVLDHMGISNELRPRYEGKLSSP
ncbi:MAG: UbiX family flavin prenyltransferase [Deltaproteobacteria bacterium]|nr:UbiX family flavin prenyltransferase [Deltaproteobacteria bacterium]